MTFFATRAQRLSAEAAGTALLLATIVGSGLMADRLAGGNVAIALLANTLATAAVLFVLIETLGPISGAHFNPVVSLVAAWRGDLTRSEAAAYVVVQFAAAIAGVALAHAMFDARPLLAAATKFRTGGGQLLSEFVATFGLVSVILILSSRGARSTGAAVAAWIAAAYWFTASTSFANPAVTLARSLSDSFTGIRPADVPAFIVAQLLAAVVAVVVVERGLLARQAQPSKSGYVP